MLKKVLSYKTNHYLKKNKAGRENISYEKARTVGVLFSVEDRLKHDVVCDFIQKLKDDGKKVTVLCFLGKNKENIDFKFDYFSFDDVSFWGKIKSEGIDKFIDQEFDFLYNLDIKTNILIDYILAKSKSKCRVGIYNERNTRLFEMMIKVDEYKNLEKIAGQLLHYTKELVSA